MNFALMFLFLILQMGVNYLLSILIDTSTLDGVIAFYLLSSLIISFIASLLATPRQFRKEFYKQPAFHKTMIIYFVIFLAFDVVSIIMRIL